MIFRATITLLGMLATGCATITSPSLTESPSTEPAAAHPRVSMLAEKPHTPKNRSARDISGHALQHTDLWQRIRDGFALPDLSNKNLPQQEKWYGARPEYIAKVVQRAQPYLFYIVEEIEKRNMPTEIALLPVVESAFNPTAYSSAHAAGLWQFIPGTARHYGLKINWWYDGRGDVIEATRAALDYLEFLHEEFDGDWFHALAAYNAGERTIQRAIKLNKSRGKPTNYSSLRLKTETRHYIPKLIAFKEVVDNPDRFGIKLAPIPNQPYFASVNTRGQIDLNVVSELSGMSKRELHRLNAAFKRWSTDPDGPYRLLVPISKAPKLTQALAELPASARVKLGRYKIREGDTLGGIARKYGLSVPALQRSNNLKNTSIRAGNDLLIPLSNAEIDIADARAVTNQVVHQVRSGDTLWRIAQRYDVYINQLARWNAIRTNDLLHLGQNIVVYMN